MFFDCISKARNKQAAKLFFKNALAFSHVFKPRVLTVDKNLDYPIAIQELKEEKQMSEGIQLRQVKYLNNIVEQDHPLLKNEFARNLYISMNMVIGIIVQLRFQ